MNCVGDVSPSCDVGFIPKRRAVWYSTMRRRDLGRFSDDKGPGYSSSLGIILHSHRELDVIFIRA
jgi:hypothetical protein